MRTDCDVIVIGNGFDLGLDYPTTYSDFMNVVKKSVEEDDYAEFEKLSKENYYWVFDRNTYDKFRKCKDNYFVSYFTNKKSIINKWCYIETELCYILKSLDKYLYNLKSDDGLTYMFEIDAADNTFIFEIYDDKNIFINGTNLKFSRDKNWKYGYLTNYDYKSTNNPGVIEERKKEIISEIIKHLYSEFIDFKDLLRLYLSEITKFDSNKKCNIDDFDYVISYNYTNSIENYLDRASVHYIHGDLNGNFVLGIDSSIDFYNNDLLMFRKSSQRSKNNEQSYSLNEAFSGIAMAGYIGLSFDKNDTGTLQVMLNSAPVNCIYYLDDNDLNSKIKNIQLILGNKYEGMLNSKRIIYKSCEGMFSKVY